MPRNVRNFWIRTRVDGRETVDATGPVSKDGGFETAILWRDGGTPAPCLSVQGFTTEEPGSGIVLKVQVVSARGEILWSGKVAR